MDAAFKSAAFNEPRIVFLKTLEEFTLGHWFLLHDLGSAFSTGEKPIEGDLIQAVFVCGQPHESARRDIKRFWTPFFFRVWGWLNRKSNFAIESSKFLAYLAESKAAPETVPTHGGRPHEPTTPQQFRLLGMLMHEFHMSRRDALNMSLREINCLWAAEMDRRGQARSGLSQRQIDLLEYAREQDALKFGREEQSGSI